MANTGIGRIDGLIAGTPGTALIGAGDTDRDAVGAIQDLLSGLGNTNLPDVRLPAHGNYGSMTATAVRQFRASHGLPASDAVDGACLTAMVKAKHSNPMASRSYIALALDLAMDSMTYLTTLTALWETNARFNKPNRNTDHAGLSFGIIQWAQKPGRLSEILTAFHHADASRFSATFGGDTASAGLLAHVARSNGGVDANGNTLDPAFNLIAEPWDSQFQAAGLDPFFQAVQVAVATADAQAAYDRMKGHATLIASQRGVGFLLDTANQHGAGGALSIYDAVCRSGMAEAELLSAMRDESVRRVSAQFGATSAEAESTASRRDWFRTTAVLSDSAI